MIRKKALQILILSVAVIMVLLRPYAAYQLSNHADLAADPRKTYDLVQRLIKKKQDHHATIKRRTKVDIALPVIRLLFNIKQIPFITAGFKRQQQITTIFHLTVKNKPYLLLSRLQV